MKGLLVNIWVWVVKMAFESNLSQATLKIMTIMIDS